MPVEPANKIVKKGSLRAPAAVIVVAIRVHVSGVVTVGHTSVRRVIIPIAAAEAGPARQRFYDPTPFLMLRYCEEAKYRQPRNDEKIVFSLGIENVKGRDSVWTSPFT